MTSVVGKIIEHMAGKLQQHVGHKVVAPRYQNKLTSAEDHGTWRRVPVWKCSLAPLGVSAMNYNIYFSSNYWRQILDSIDNMGKKRSILQKFYKAKLSRYLFFYFSDSEPFGHFPSIFCKSDTGWLQIYPAPTGQELVTVNYLVLERTALNRTDTMSTCKSRMQAYKSKVLKNVPVDHMCCK